MIKAFAYAFALAGLTASVHAADLDLGGLKDPVPDSLPWHGITVYGTIDIAYGYQTHGAPLDGSFAQGVSYNIYSSKFANKSISSLDPGALERNGVGVKFDEELAAAGWPSAGSIQPSTL